MFRLDNLGIVIEAPSAPYPYGRLINSNPLGSGNGSPAIAEWANDPILGMYAALDHFGLMPSDLQEQVGDSDLVRILEAVLPVGAFIDFGSDSDPALLNVRALVCDGSTISQATYPELYAAIGTKWNTGGEPVGTFRLPAARGKFRRAFDAGAGVDPGRVFAAPQTDQMQGHRHWNGVRQSVAGSVANYGDTTDEITAGQTVGYSAVPAVDQGISSEAKNSGIYSTPVRVGNETRPINYTGYVWIRY